MRLVVRAAEITRAERLIPISRAHLDDCLFHGRASLDFVERIAADDARVAVPTTLNVGTVDLLHPELFRGTAELAHDGTRLMDAYRALGCRPSYTCAPYQLADARPRLGEQVAWGESNAVVFCNSVLGARTNRYGDFIDAACAVTGLVPDAGLHRAENRRARLLLSLGDDVPLELWEDDSAYPILGLAIGRRAGGEVVAVDGLPRGIHEDHLKAIGAAAASSGGVALLHVVGSTPEAPSVEDALGGLPAEAVGTITMADLRRERALLTPAASSDRLRAVSLGTPHASLAELTEIARLLDDDRVASGVELLVSTARDVLARAEELGVAARLRRCGTELLVDTCSYVTPVLRAGDGPVMTNSGKWAFYAPGNIGARVVLGSTAECIASAVAGRVVRLPSAWDRP